MHWLFFLNSRKCSYCNFEGKSIDIDKNNKDKQYVLTKDIKLNIERTAFFLENKFLNKPVSNLKIGI